MKTQTFFEIVNIFGISEQISKWEHFLKFWTIFVIFKKVRKEKLNWKRKLKTKNFGNSLTLFSKYLEKKRIIFKISEQNLKAGTFSKNKEHFLKFPNKFEMRTFFERRNKIWKQEHFPKFELFLESWIFLEKEKLNWKKENGKIKRKRKTWPQRNRKKEKKRKNHRKKQKTGSRNLLEGSQNRMG